MEVVVQDHWFSMKECFENSDKLYVFGDNLKRTGNGGQAIIRDCPNSIGFATKKSPSMARTAFFTDLEYEQNVRILENEFRRIFKSFQLGNYKYIVLPKDGLGTGLSDMPVKCPRTFKALCFLINNYFKVNLTDRGFT